MRILLWVAGLVTLTLWTTYFVWAVLSGPTRAGAIFGGIAAVLGLLGLAAAAGALLTTLGPYRRWRQETFDSPSLVLGLRAGNDADVLLGLATQTMVVREPTLHLAVRVGNRSTFPVRGIDLVIGADQAVGVERLKDQEDDRLVVRRLIEQRVAPGGGPILVRTARARLDLAPGQEESFGLTLRLPASSEVTLVIEAIALNGGVSSAFTIRTADFDGEQFSGIMAPTAPGRTGV